VGKQRGARLVRLSCLIGGPKQRLSALHAFTQVALVVLIVSSLVACRDRIEPSAALAPSVSSPTAAASVATISASPSSIEDVDRSLIDAMVPYHEGVRELSSIALTRVEHPELRPLLSELVRVQGLEINEMRRWRQQWFGSSATPPMRQIPRLSADATSSGAPSMNMEAEIVRLRSAPAPFDRAFIDTVIPHFQNTLDLARLAEKRAARPELAKLAATIIDRQQRESDQLIQWRQAWYGNTGSPSSAPARGVMPGVDPSQGPRDGQDPHQGH
jgi:uncharacterized protein (DUF305 family)